MSRAYWAKAYPSVDNILFMILALPFWYAAFLFSATAHEAAHAWAARQGGDPTAYLGGQVSLDPRPHIRQEPWGLVWIPLITFFLQGGQWMIGWASTPYNSTWAERFPRRAFGMAMAGPSANWALVLTSGMLLRVMVVSQTAGAFDPTRLMPFCFVGNGLFGLVAGMLLVLFTINLVLGVFNLLPIPPLDGATLLGLVLNRENYAMVIRFGRQNWIVCLLVSWWVFGRVFPYIEVTIWRMLFAGARVAASAGAATFAPV